MLLPGTIEFLNELKDNNSKIWFDQNRKRYDTLKSDYLLLAENILTKMKQIDPVLEGLNPKDCIFRINRDVRFSADKSPYKTNLGIALHPGNKKFNFAAYYVHIEPGQSFVGGGLWMPESTLLSKVRKEIHFFYSDFFEILNDQNFKKNFQHLDIEEGQKLIRPPKGYDESDPAIEYLKLKSFTVSKPIADDLLVSPDLIPYIINSLTAIKPFIAFINRGLLSDNEGGL